MVITKTITLGHSSQKSIVNKWHWCNDFPKTAKINPQQGKTVYNLLSQKSMVQKIKLPQKISSHTVGRLRRKGSKFMLKKLLIEVTTGGYYIKWELALLYYLQVFQKKVGSTSPWWCTGNHCLVCVYVWAGVRECSSKHCLVCG